MSLTTEQKDYLAAQYRHYKKSRQYEYRKEQRRFCDFARAFICYLVNSNRFDEDSATMLVHVFAVNAKKESIKSTIESSVSDSKAKSNLLGLLDSCYYLGYTAVGKSKIELTEKQAVAVKSFLGEILKNDTIEGIKKCVRNFTDKKIPNCTTGIYSPWLHYIHPNLCPIANGAIEPFLSYLGVPKSKKGDYLYMIDLLTEAKEASGAEDFSMLDDFLFSFNDSSMLNDRPPRYWVFNHKFEGASEKEKLDLRLQAIANNYAFMQYEYGYQHTSSVTINWKSAIQVREGDYIFLKSDRVYAVGIAVSPRKESTLELSAEEIIKKRSHGPYLSGKCKELITFTDAEVFYEDLLDGEARGWGQRIDVDSWKYYNPNGVWMSADEYTGGTVYDAIREISEKEGKRLINQLNKGLGMKTEVMKQLEHSHNLILTGAPGTGKTYLAKQVARLMLFGKSDNNELNDAEKEIYRQHVEFVQFHPSYDYSDFVEGLRPVQSEDGNQLGFERKDGIFKLFCKRAIEDTVTATGRKHMPYIMIIDEINRGEINKILGELFYSIDPGYRGKEGCVNTQYQNMLAEDDIFYNGFYVPENVYILGTMNDIDRSVESMDFAIRRRFTWREIAPKDTQKDMLNLLDDDIRQESIKRMDSLNAAIMDPDSHLGAAYQIGASYFLKLKENQSFEDLWEYHLKGVLYEYLRGQREIDDKISKLRKAFFCESDNE